MREKLEASFEIYAGSSSPVDRDLETSDSHGGGKGLENLSLQDFRQMEMQLSFWRVSKEMMSILSVLDLLRRLLGV